MHAILRISVVVALASCSGASSTAKPSTSPAVERESIDPNLAPTSRLGDASTPTAYRLRFALDARLGSFLGEASIDIDIHAPVHTLWLHSKELQIASAQLEQGGEFHDLETMASESDSELLGLTSDRNFASGHAQLHLRWRGNLGSIEGLFRQVEEGVGYIYSDFEAIDARAAFPGYDDPRFKTPWTISIEVPSEHRAFSNAPELRRTRLANGNDLVHFAPTRPLPSYLVALAAGPFESISGTASTTPLRIIAPKGQAENGRYVLEKTGTMLRYLEEYLGEPMPFPKLDFIAVPRFGGAMENPGLITFSSAILLVGSSPSEQEKRRALGVTAHELAHLWFGDLVTPDYWTDLWLNEAFATWLSDKAVAHAQPSRASEVLDIADKTAAYSIDHGLGGRRVREPIKSREDIRAAFDRITYRKGGALLTMLEAWLGPKRMQDAVRHYLRAGDGGTVDAETLVSSLSKASDDPGIAPFFASFLSQTGIPQVHARVRCDGKPRLTLSQSRYLPLEVRREQEPSDLVRSWHVPVCFRYATAGTNNSETRQCVVLDSPEKSVPLSSCPTWLLPNDGDTGYYHYLLSAKGFAALPIQALSPRETLGFAHSVVAGMHAGQFDVGETLDLLEPLALTSSEKVHELVFDTLYLLSRSVIAENQRSAFAATVRRWYEPLARRVGVAPSPNEPAWIASTRPALLLLLAELGESEFVRSEVSTRVESWLGTPTNVEFILLDSWLRVAVRSGNRTLVERYRQASSKTRESIDRVLLFGALHAIRNADILLDVMHRGPRPATVWPILAESLVDPKLRTAIFGAITSADLEEEEALELFAVLCDADALADAKRFLADDARATELLAPGYGCLEFANAQRASAAAHFGN